MSSQNLFQAKQKWHSPELSTPRALGPDTIGLFNDILERGLTLRVKATGRSMAPFLRGGEILTIRHALPSSLRRGDLVLFTNSTGAPKIHRLIRRMLDHTGTLSFVTKGDALGGFDEAIRGDDVLGKVIAVEKVRQGNKTEYINMESLRWRAANQLNSIVQDLKTTGYYYLFKIYRLCVKILSRRHRVS